VSVAGEEPYLFAGQKGCGVDRVAYGQRARAPLQFIMKYHLYWHPLTVLSYLRLKRQFVAEGQGVAYRFFLQFRATF